MDYQDVIIIGAGASGLAAAVAAGEHGDKVLVLERSEHIGRKLLASGNGRCNLMNTAAPVYYGDTDFALSVLSNYNEDRLIGFWRHYGLKLRSDTEGRVYPATNKSSSVLDTLTKAVRLNDGKILLSAPVLSVKKQDDLFQVVTDNGKILHCRRVIVSAGGAAQPKLGGSYDGYSILQKFGHRLIPVHPALTRLIAEPKTVSGLSGIRVKCIVSVKNNGVTVHSEKGELLFTDNGISGICVMQCSRFVIPNISICHIDLIYDLFPSDDYAFQELSSLREIYADEAPQTLIQGICVPKLAFAVCKQAGIPVREYTCRKITDKQITDIIKTLHCYSIKIIGKEGFESAQISAGGISCEEFSPATMESLVNPGLYASGEVLNVDGACGGYNLMFAFASGILAGTAGRGIYD